MKRLIVPVLLPVLVLAVSCEKNQNFQKIVEAPPTLVYVAEAGIDNAQQTKIVRLPDSFITSEKRFQVNVNSSLHEAATAVLTASSAGVAEYNAKYGTNYPELPAANYSVTAYVKPAPAGEGETETVTEDPFSPSTSATVHIGKDARLSDEFVRIRLGGDLGSLTQDSYLVALALECPELDLSVKKNMYYLLVNFTDELVKSITSASDMVGEQIDAAVRRNFTADVDGYASLFDNSTGSAVSFPKSEGNVVTVDMQETYKFSGLSLRGANYIYPYIMKLEISSDGENFTNMGDVGSDNYFMNSYQCYSSLIVGVNTRYVRVTFDFYSPYGAYGANYKDRLAEIYVYVEN